MALVLDWPFLPSSPDGLRPEVSVSRPAASAGGVVWGRLTPGVSGEVVGVRDAFYASPPSTRLS